MKMQLLCVDECLDKYANRLKFAWVEDKGFLAIENILKLHWDGWHQPVASIRCTFEM